MKIAIIVLAIMLTSVTVLVICLTIRCKQLNKQVEELNNMPVQTVIKEVVVNPKIKTFEIKRILSADVIRFGGEGYKEMTKKQMVHELSEGLVLNDLITFYEEKDLYRMEEIITASIDVLGR